jgi:iodotyrosine deiodinase
MKNYIQIPAAETTNIDSVSESEKFFKRMSSRRTIRHFSSQPIDKKIIYNAIKTAGSAPSGANRQPWHFALITSQVIKEKIRSAAERVEHEFYENRATEEWINDLKKLATNSQKPYLTEAPALIAIFSRSFCETEDGILKRSYYPTESTGIAAGFLLTALHNAGLATLTHTPRPMFFLNEVLGLNKTYKPFMIIVTGYPKQPVFVPNLTRKSLPQIMEEH